MVHSFSIQEAIRFGWHKTREHSALVFQVVLTIFGLQVLQAVVAKTIESSALGLMASVVLVVLEFFVGIGATVIALKLARNYHAAYADIMPPARMAWRYLLASLLVALFVLGGLILLIVPGIYFMLRFSLVRFAIVDGAEVRESLRISAAATRGVKWKLLGFFVVLLLLNILGMLLFLVGLLITLPVSLIATAHVYLTLKGHHHPAPAH